MWPFKKNIVDVQVSEVKKTDTWTPVPGYEEYYMQNQDGKIKTTGREFDFHMERRKDELMSAFLTISYLKGYFHKEPIMQHNFDMVRDVLKKLVDERFAKEFAEREEKRKATTIEEFRTGVLNGTIKTVLKFGDSMGDLVREYNIYTGKYVGNRKDYSCDGRCGSTYCDEHGCIEQKQQTTN